MKKQKEAVMAAFNGIITRLMKHAVSNFLCV